MDETKGPARPVTEAEPPLAPAGDMVLLGSTARVGELMREGLLDRVLSKVMSWSRRSSLWPLMFGTACCFVEMAATGGSRYDISRFGSEVMRASPRQADLMIVPGTVTKKMVPLIVRLYHQMPDPKYVIAMGACAISGGPFKEGYNVVSGIDEFIPVDVYVPGCPPKPEALLYGLMKLQAKIDQQPLRWVREPRPTASRQFPIPVLGPDLIDVRQLDEIRARTLAPVAEPLAEAPAEELKKRPHRPGEAPAKTLAPGQALLVPPGDFDVSLRDRLQAVPGANPTDDPELGGVVFATEKLFDIAQVLRAELGFDYLSNLTSVDFPDRFEVVYHLYATERVGPPLLLKAALPRDNPEVASVVSIWQGADFQEREVWDMMGIRFTGHPNLTRILLWEGFEGFPLRKDYREPYYEEPAKPFGSRWPDGVHIRAEERNPYGRNVQYPHGFDPASFVELDEHIPIVDAMDVKTGIPDTDKLIVSFGPQHPSTHGVFRMVTTLSGETITHVAPVMGYLHRNHEKIGERSMWMQVMPYTDRLDYICSMSNNLGYALAVEKLLGQEVPERAEYIRVIMAEFTRIVNHLMATGTLLNDLGAFFTPVLYAFEEREMILDLFEMTAGSRMMCNYMRFGGVARDLPDGFMERARALVEDRLPRAIDEFDRYLTRNEILVARLKGIGKLTAAQAINLSASGPMLRASGVPYDVRRAEPYSIYDRFDFDIPVGQNGDTYDRYLVRIQEMRESLKILRQALHDIPPGEVLAGQKRWQIRVPKGDAYARIEAPKGELGFYVVSDGGPNPYRYHVRAPSFINLTGLNEMARGHQVADLIAIFGAVDINMGEVDR